VCAYTPHLYLHTLPPTLIIEQTQKSPLSFLLSKITPHDISGDEVQEKEKIKRNEDLGTRVGDRPVRRACSVHEGSMLIKSRSRQAFGQGVGDIEGTTTLV